VMEPDGVLQRLSYVQPAHLSTMRQPLPEVSIDPLLVHVELASLSFDAWYAENRPLLARALALSIGDVDLADEAIDEAMTRACESWPSVSRLGNPTGWVYRVALNWALSVFRRRNRPARTVHVTSEEMPVPVDSAVRQALDGLDVKYRTVVVCRHLLGWSERETAESLNIRPGTVKSRLSRANAQLRAQLEHLRPEDS
jgi:RNA polymerase sigma factor (sigma-70 family)